MNLATYLPAAKEALNFFAYTITELAVLFIGISFLVGAFIASVLLIAVISGWVFNAVF